MRSDLEMRLLFQIALSIGATLDLDKQLEKFLSELLTVTRGFGGAVFQRTRKSGQQTSQWRLMRCIPNTIKNDANFAPVCDTACLARWWNKFEKEEAQGYIIENNATLGGCAYVFRLPHFGLLILFHRSSELSSNFCDVLKVVARRLAHSCISCLKNDELQRRWALEKLVAKWSVKFINIDENDFEDNINAALGDMGSLVGADRAYVFHYDWDNGVSHNTHEWCEDGVTREIENLQGVSNEGLDDLIGSHCRGEVYLVADVQALSDTATLRGILESQGIKTNITVPLMAQGACFGFMGFDAVREKREWDEIDETVLKMMADLFANIEIRKKQQEALKEAQRETLVAMYEASEMAVEAGKANKAKSRFLAMISHDLRTPLTLITSNAEALEERREVDIKKVERIKDASSVLERMISEILQFTEIQNKGVPLERERFRFRSWFFDTTNAFEEQAYQKGLVFRREVDDAVPEAVVGDWARLTQILGNLLSNALKFTHHGSVALRVFTQPEGGEGLVSLAIEVEDSGTGMEPKLINALGEPFVRGLEKAWPDPGGTGLGLAIVKRLVQAMGGSLVISSEIEVGTRATVELRLEVAKTGGEERSKGKALRFDGSSGPSCGASLDGVNILIVEDDEAVRDILEETLELMGCSVVTGVNGQDAVCKAKENRFDMIFMDCQMPVMNGLEATGAIRSAEGKWGEKTPIIALTAAVGQEDQEQCYKAGMNDILTKPYTKKRLAEMLQRWVGGGNSRFASG